MILKLKCQKLFKDEEILVKQQIESLKVEEKMKKSLGETQG